MPTTSDSSPFGALTALIATHASDGELRVLIRRVTPEVEHGVNWNQPHHIVVDELVHAWQRHGHLQSSRLFEQLCGWRPHLQREIREVACLLKVQLPIDPADSSSSEKRSRDLPPQRTYPDHNKNSPHVWPWITALLIFYFWVFAYGPDKLPPYKQSMLAVVGSLIPALLGGFISGQIGVALGSRRGSWLVRATGGFACYAISFYGLLGGVSVPLSTPHNQERTPVPLAPLSKPSEPTSEILPQPTPTPPPRNPYKKVQSVQLSKCDLGGERILLELAIGDEKRWEQKLLALTNHVAVEILVSGRLLDRAEIVRYIPNRTIDAPQLAVMDQCLKRTFGAQVMIAPTRNNGYLYKISLARSGGEPMGGVSQGDDV